MKISAEQLEQVSDLYARGYYLQAYRISESIGPLAEWEGTPAMLLAGFLANNLGSQTLGRQLHLKAYRLDPNNGEAAYYKAGSILARRGPLAAWYFMRRIGETIDGSATVQSDWLASHATVLGALRDFDAAAEWLAKAEKLDPNNPWLWVERSHLLELEDRYEEALTAAHHALGLHPYFRPGVQALAHLLVLLGRDADALDVLNEAAGKIESCWLVAQLARLQTELGLHREARQSIERFAELAPLRDKDIEQWLAAQRADAAYLCGDYRAALHYTELSESPFHKLTAEKMQAAAADASRVLLSLGFVRQHHVTCVPATLTLISRFWHMPADHLSVVEAICYDGTPARSERDWAEKQGWFTREFCVNWDDTVKLIDRGVPFTFTTVEPGNAHMQAVIGYDSRRGTILARDPYDRNLVEYAAKETFERYRSSGPRGMAMVPLAQKHLLENLELREADLYDGLYQVQQALYAHDRARAEALLATMANTAEEHRLTCQAELAVAEYDCDDPRVLASLEKLLALFPDDANWWVYKLSVLRRMARRQERLDLLKSICAGKQAQAMFWQMYAAELGDDGRERARALKWLRRALRHRPLDAHNFYLLAHHLWSGQRFNEAKELYRFAACLRDTQEDYVRSYFLASRFFREQSEALAFLAGRFRRFGRRSNSPVRTLAWAYEQTEQQPQALAALKEGLALRPDDGDLMLHAADLFARVGQFDEAALWLEKAENKARRVDWLQTSAVIASYRGDVKAALALWLQVAEAEPLNLSATRNVAQALAETTGEGAAIAFLRERVGRFPHNLALHRLLVERLRNQPDEIEPAVRAMIEVDPMDAWARRELAMALAAGRDYPQALAEAQLARQMEPAQPDGYNVLASVHTGAGDMEEAKTAYRRAIELSVDSDCAIGNLMAISHSVEERRAALRFIKDELIRQVIFGDGLLAYRDYARGTLDNEELHELLQAALKARPDLWHAWSALVLQLTDMQRYDEALDLARQAAERFPLVPRVWFDLAEVHRARLDREGQVQALERALEINPNWGRAVRQLADIYLNAGEAQKARAMLEQAIARTPLDFENYGCLANVLWRSGEKEQAIERLKRALTVEPGYNWAWVSLRAWSRELKREDETIAFLREMAERRPGEARSWMWIAEGLSRLEDLPERLQALDRANELNPRLVDAHVLRAKLLADAKRYGEARAACRPEVFSGALPLALRNTAAMVEAQSGNTNEALEQMRAIVAEEPNNYEAWNQLADWTAPDLGHQSEYLKAATEMVRIAPNYAVSFGYLGAARRSTGDRPGAKEAFRRSLALSPDYAYGGFNLFDLQLEDGEIDAAKETLRFLRQNIGGHWVTAREIELTVKQGDAETATRLLRYLCRETQAERPIIEDAIKHMDWNHLQEQVEQVLDESLDIPTANSVAGEVWADRWIQRGKDGRCPQRLDKSSEKTAVWQRAAATYLEKAPPDARLANAYPFIQNHAAALRADNETWGLVGYTLYEMGRYQETVAWLSDWHSRGPLGSWILWNYALALRMLERHEEAYQAGEEALRLGPDDLSDEHRVLLALDDALTREFEKAAARLRQIRFDGLRAWSKFGYNTAVIVVNASRPSARRMSELSRLAELREANPFFWTDPLFFRSHWRATEQIAASANVAVKVRARLALGRLYLKRRFIEALNTPLGKRLRILGGA
jgi:tetratricopeptide (TPR) repeat protein